MNRKLRGILLMMGDTVFTWENDDLDYIIKEVIREFLEKVFEKILNENYSVKTHKLYTRLKKELEGEEK